MSKIESISYVMEEEPVSSRDKVGTVMDQRDMERVGKTQELRRNFRLISVLGFTAVLMCTWEAILLYARQRYTL